MEFKLIKIILSAAFLIIPAVISAQELFMSGRVEGIGTFFEVADSEYLNISLQSTEEITVSLESIPKTINLLLGPSTSTNSAILTIGGLEPNKTYYKFQDSYKNEAVFVSDSQGKYAWSQDLTRHHHVWLQEINGTVFLPEDCSNYGVWNQDTSSCSLNQNITSSVEITDNNITLDCAGRSIIGAGTGPGIYLGGKAYAAVKNCVISNFSVGIYQDYSSFNNLTDNLISNSYGGIFFGWNSHNNIIAGNILSNGWAGIALSSSGNDNNTIANNTVSNYYYGSYFLASHQNTLNNNTISSSTVYGIYLAGSRSNTVNGNTISDNNPGIFLQSNSDYNTLTNNAFINDGLSVAGSFHNTLQNNTVNSKPLIYLENASNQTIKDTPAGQVILINSDNVTVENLDISNTYFGIELWGTNNSRIIGNNLSNNQTSINLNYSDNNTVRGNTIFDSQYGFHLYSSNNNETYHNNFLNNGTQAYTIYGINNLFDNNLPDGGNYWSNYDTPAEGCSDADNDGFCDTPYTFTGGQDRYPFMDENGWEMPTLPDLTISEIKPIQVVWDSKIDDNDAIDLVSGKSTMVRVFVGIENYEALDKQQLVDVRLNFEGIDYIESKTIEQLEQNTWIDFYPSSPVIIGDQTIIAEVDPENTIEEVNETNNGNSAEITAKDTNGLNLIYFPIDRPITYFGYGPINLGEYVTTVSQSGKFIGATYPVAEGEFINQREDIIYDGSRIKFVGMVKDAIKISKLGELLTGTLVDRSVGIVPTDYFEYHDIIPGVDIGDWRGKSYPAITGVLVREGYWATAAHEIGHTYGLGHVEEEYNINGFWVTEESPIENRACFMSAAPDWHTSDFTWIKDDNYANLFKKFRVDKTDPDVLLVSGLIFKDGRIELENWYRLEVGVVDEVAPGDYSIQILDINGQILDIISFDAPFETYVTPDGPVEADVTGFAFVVPYPEGTSKIQIKHEEETLMEINPNSKLLYDAVDLIPDYGFINDPWQRRNALHNKIEALEKMIEQGNFRGAVNKLENDIKDKLEKWLIDDYQKEDILQLSKVEVIEMIDGLIYRIGLMLANNKK